MILYIKNLLVIGDWGLGIGDWGFWVLGRNPQPQPPNHTPQNKKNNF